MLNMLNLIYDVPLCVCCVQHFFLIVSLILLTKKKQLHERIFRGSGRVLGMKIKTEIDRKQVYGLNSILLQLAGEK